VINGAPETQGSCPSPSGAAKQQKAVLREGEREGTRRGRGKGTTGHSRGGKRSRRQVEACLAAPLKV